MLKDGMAAQSETDRRVQAGPGRAAASRAAYCRAVAERSTLTGRLAMSTARGDVVVSMSRAQIA